MAWKGFPIHAIRWYHEENRLNLSFASRNALEAVVVGPARRALMRISGNRRAQYHSSLGGD
jgi:hypothetical protein